MGNNLLNLLYEELILENRKSELVHYTDIYGLVGIVRHGIILSQDYEKKATRNKKTTEVSTLRRSVDSVIKKSRDDLKELTLNAEEVKIYLFEKNILSSVRGVKKVPISEYNHYYNKETLRENLKRFIKTEAIVNITVEELEDFIIKSIHKIHKTTKSKEMIKLIKTDREVIKPIYKDFEERFKINTLDNSYARSTLTYLIKDYVYYVFPQHTREGEERFVFKKGSGIPFSSKYMKIRIVKMPSDKELFNTLGEKDIREDFLVKVNKNIKAFLIDGKFKEFIKRVENLNEK